MGGRKPFSFSRTGTLPPGAAFASDTATCSITAATLGAVGSYTGSITVTDADGRTGNLAFTINVTAAAATIPDAVSTLAAGAAGDGSIPLTWTAPANGGSAITDYVVQYRTSAGPGAWQTFADGTSAATGATVTGLTNGTGYDFLVFAVNAVGQGPASNVVSGTPAAGSSQVASIAFAAGSPLAGTEAINRTIVVTLDAAAPAGGRSVNFTTAGVGNTPSVAADYVPAALPAGSVTIAAGQTTGTATLTLNDNSTAQGDRVGLVSLAAGSGYTIGSPADVRFSIIDNDASANISRDTYVTSGFGSSSTQGGQGPLGYSTINRIPVMLPNGAKAVYNRGVSGAQSTELAAQIGAMTADEKTGVLFAQYGNNDLPNAIGGAWVHFGRYHNDIKPLIPTAVAGKRVYALETGVSLGDSISRLARVAQMLENHWTDTPGRSCDLWEVLKQLPMLTQADIDTIADFKSPFAVTARNDAGDHFSDPAYAFWARLYHVPVVAAENGGPPFLVFHLYHGNLAGARTNGGDVCELFPIGDLTGATFQVRTRAGGVHPDFGVRVAGSQMFLTRVSATAILRGWTELFISATKGGNTQVSRIKVAIGSLGAAPNRSYVDGHTILTADSNDNTGSLTAPSVPATPAFFLSSAIAPSGQTEFSFVVDAEADDPLVSGVYQERFLFQLGNMRLYRLASGAIRFAAANDDGGQNLGQITGNTTASGGRLLPGDGRKLIFYSCKVDGSTFQQLVFDNGGAAALQTVTSTPNASATTVRLNPNASVVNTFLVEAGPPHGKPWIGYIGTIWLANKAIDWTVEANRLLFRTSGLGAMVNLPLDGAVTVASGINAGVSVTPFFYHRGHAGDLMQGRNYGTGGRLWPICRHDDGQDHAPTAFAANPLGAVA